MRKDEKKPGVLDKIKYVLMLKKMLDTMEASLPKFTFKKGESSNDLVPMKDGIHLMTRIFFPKGKGKFPVILTRNPYVDSDNGASVNIIFRYLVRYGFIVVCQECRGRGKSEGEWVPFTHEREDGLETIDWIKAQPWCDGRIGLWGNSYTAYADWTMADALPQEVKTMFLAVMGTEQYKLNYMNGMFRHELWTLWSVQNTPQKIDRTWQELYDEFLLARPFIDADEKVLKMKLEWYRKTIENPDPSAAYWQQGQWKDIEEMPSKIRIPVGMAEGWFDIGLQGQMTAFWNLSPEIRAKSAFICGPWTHALTAASDFDCPGQDIIGFLGIRGAVEWFNYQFHGAPFTKPLGVMSCYTIGENRWKTHAEWPPKGEIKKLFFTMDEKLPFGGGTLDEVPSEEQGSFSYIYDPQSPVPTCGGFAFLPTLVQEPGHPVAGSRLQPQPGYRGDVLSFMSKVFPEDWTVEGNIKINLMVASSAEDTCFSAKVIHIHPDGKAFNMCDGITTLMMRNGKNVQPYHPGEIIQTTIEMWPVSWCVTKGSVLRIDISSSDYPAYHAHSNTKEPWAYATKSITARQTLHTGGDLACYVELPITK